MKKANVFSALLIGTTLLGWIAILPHSAVAQGQAQQSPWKDRAEYDAFNAIVTAQDPKQKIDLADKYLAAYPQTKFPDKVNEMKLQSYQQLNDIPKVTETANKLLEINPKHFYSLFLLTSIFPQTFNPKSANADQELTTAMERAKTGLELVTAMPKPDNISDADFKKQKDQLEATFHQTLGFAALQKKDFDTAQQELHKSLEINPTNAAGFYQLALAYTTATTPKKQDGIWAMAHALSITGPTALPEAMKPQVKEYLGAVYHNQHGGDEGLDDVLKEAASAPFPPADFHIKTAEEVAAAEPPPAPTPAPAPKRELTVKPEELSSYDVIQKYLQSGGQKADDTWELLKGSSLTLPGKVISATPAAKPKTIHLAVAPELANQDVKFDVEVTLAEPSAKAFPKGSNAAFEGIVDSYQPKPFLLRLADAKVAK